MHNRIIVIWLNLNTGQYYHKIYRSFFHHEVGYINQYNHQIIDIVEYKEIVQKYKHLRRLIRKVISFLENILKKL